MARLTLEIADPLLRRIRQRAKAKGRTPSAEINALLRQALAAPPRSGYRLRLATWSGELQPGVDLFDRNSLFERMERG